MFGVGFVRGCEEEFVELRGSEDFAGAGAVGGAAEFFREVERGFETETLLVEFFLVVKPLLIAVGFPSGDVVMGETGMAEVLETFGDRFESDSIGDPLVDFVAERAWQAGDFAVGAAGGTLYRRQRR